MVSAKKIKLVTVVWLTKIENFIRGRYWYCNSDMIAPAMDLAIFNSPIGLKLSLHTIDLGESHLRQQSIPESNLPKMKRIVRSKARVFELWEINYSIPSGSNSKSKQWKINYDRAAWIIFFCLLSIFINRSQHSCVRGFQWSNQSMEIEKHRMAKKSRDGTVKQSISWRLFSRK